MKKLNAVSIFIGFLMLMPLCIFGQGLGFKAGLNMTNLKVEPDFADTDAKIGFQVGAFYELAAGEMLTIRPGLSYSAKGAKDPDTDESISLNYLDVPVDIVYKLNLGTNKLGIHAGPYIGMLLSASGGDGEDIKDFLKSTDFGINLGVGYELQNIVIGLNYGLGLSNINDDPDFEEVTFKNTNISVTVGYRL